MILSIDDKSPVPVFEQVRQQFEALIVSGDLSAGERLPTVRQLASDLGLAGGTVVRAYRELEQAGLIETRGRHGTVVADIEIRSAPRSVLKAAATYAAEARRRGVALDDAISALRAAFATGAR